MKKFVVYLLISIFFYFILDYCVYKIEIYRFCNRIEKSVIDFKFPPYYKYFFHNYGKTLLTFKIRNIKELKKYFRKPNIIENSKKGSILIFGCSFAYGSGLEPNETFSNILSNYTQRNVYNLAVDSCGIQHMYYFLQYNDIYKQFNPVPEYAIYVYIPNHLARLDAYIFPHSIFTNGLNIRYKLKKNSIELIKNIPIVSRSFVIRKIILLLEQQKDNSTKELQYSNFAIANELFLRSKQLLQEKYPNMKFVVLTYDYDYYGEIDNDKYDEIGLELPFMWNVLEKEGFIIIHSSDLMGRYFHLEDTCEDNYHPSLDVWNSLVPKIVKKLNI